MKKKLFKAVITKAKTFPKKIDKTMHRAKNTILTMLAVFATVLCVGSICCLDSATWIPCIVCILSLGYLFLFALANNFFGGEARDVS